MAKSLEELEKENAELKATVAQLEQVREAEKDVVREALKFIAGLEEMVMGQQPNGSVSATALGEACAVLESLRTGQSRFELLEVN